MLTFNLRRLRSPLAGLLLLPITAGAAAQNGSYPFVATPLMQFEYRAAPRPMRMPTAVSVAPDGRVFVADGAHDRILVFDPDGAASEIREIGGITLRQPVGLYVDAAGRLWIADTGNHRVVMFEPGPAPGGPVQIIEVPPSPGGHPADVTDVRTSPDGRHLWVVDNDGHRLLRLEISGGAWQVFGEEGEALGQLRYPFQLAIAGSGDVFVTDVINARVHLFDPQGRPLATVGVYGLERGGLYRPKGVAVDQAGRVWVSDSVTGVVQVFRDDGACLDVLRDAAGRVLRFETPCGLAFDAGGHLYVVELTADRVQKLQIAAQAGPLLPVPARPARIGTARQARSCTICHIEWMPEFSEGRAGLLMPPPEARPDDPPVSQAWMCLSCHDGSVVDSRLKVWEEHGHRTGVTPPDTMRVPEHLPLVEGRIACRTCHSAHTAGQPTGDIRTAVFLRVPNPASELCMSCHTDKVRGPAFGTHPTGGMPWAVPQALVEAGARVGPNPRELTCQVCHTAHGARFDHLLVMGTSSNQLCLTCHDQMRPGMFIEGPHHEHPLSARLTPEQVEAVAAMGTRLGPEGQLICLSCHKLHHGKADRFLLADDLTEGQMCLRCHAERNTLVGSPHDLRTNFPGERNRLGLTASTGGPCSSCHLFHRYARERTPGPVDREGLCLTCHDSGRCAQRKVLGPVNHPEARCTDCHDPHEPRFGHFLRARAEDLCLRCHGEHAALTGGPHDLVWRAAGRLDSPAASLDRCLACHRPHGNEATGLWRSPPSREVEGPDAVCLACHAGAAWHAAGSIAAQHPQSGSAALLAEGMPLVPGPGGERIGCRTCHDPHAGATGNVHLLRMTGPGSPEGLCITCHRNTAHIALTGHNAASLKRAGFEVGACRPCHQAHASSEEVEKRLMWSRALLRGRQPEPDSEVVTDRYCTGCHADGGWAHLPGAITHPSVAMFDPFAASLNGDLALFDPNGQRDPFGRIACRTCHTPHGRAAPPGGEDASFGDHVLRAAGLQLRPFHTPNACVSCHSEDALRRFLYFHDPQRRGGARPQPTVSRTPALSGTLPGGGSSSPPVPSP